MIAKVRTVSSAALRLMSTTWNTGPLLFKSFSGACNAEETASSKRCVMQRWSFYREPASFGRQGKAERAPNAGSSSRDKYCFTSPIHFEELVDLQTLLLKSLSSAEM